MLKSCKLIWVAMCFSLFAYSNAKGQGFNHGARYTSRLVERLREITKPALVSPNRFTCLPCLLQGYKNELLKTETRSVRTRNPMSNDYKSKMKLLPTINSLSRSFNAGNPYNSKFINNYKMRRPLSNFEKLPLPVVDKNYFSDYSASEDRKISYEDLEDNYIDELSNDLSDYSAHSDYFNNEVAEDLDYTEHLVDPHEEMCKTRKTWKLLNETRNQKGQIVRVLQRTHEGDLQFVYIYECVNTECERCRGVDHNSRCRMRESYLNLYHEVNGKTQYGYVVVPTHCTCELLPHHFFPKGCSNSKRDRMKRK